MGASSGDKVGAAATVTSQRVVQARQVASPMIRATATMSVASSATSVATPSLTVEAVSDSTREGAPSPTPTGTPSLTPSPMPSPTPTATPVACDQRGADDGLLTLVTRDFGLSREYVPPDLTPLSDYFAFEVTMGYPTEVSALIVEPLQQVVAAMKAEGLSPQIVSGYRSYSAQAVAFRKWLAEYPDWGSHLSAPPGHSEHQLGTTVDFGSPELKYMLGEAYVQFHPAFAQTSEGEWLAENAAEFGFTMSYPDGAFERTTFYYEPWHFRYVGEELATELKASGLALNEYLQREQPMPCIVE